MSDVFVVGEEGSRGKLVGQLEALQALGELALTRVDRARLESLVTFERRLSALNGRRQRAHRVLPPLVAAKFVVGDFFDLDQAATTATVRADAQVVTLRERQVPALATVRVKRFSVTSGVAESLDSAGNLYRAYTDDEAVPVGTFDLELIEPLTLTLLVFDLAAMPSSPILQVEVSATGSTYTSVTQVALNGYRLTAWCAPQTVRFIRLRMRPSHPDTLGGRTYTFGLTAFSGSTVEFHLLSELVTRPVTFRPRTTQLQLVAPERSGLTYFLSFNGGGFIETPVNTPFPIPGVAAAALVNIGVDAAGKLVSNDVTPLPTAFYPETLRASWDGRPDEDVWVVPGLAPMVGTTDARLSRHYLALNGNVAHLVTSDLAAYPGKTFTLSFLTGPAAATVQLKVQLATGDRSTTPIFRGARLEEI